MQEDDVLKRAALILDVPVAESAERVDREIDRIVRPVAERIVEYQELLAENRRQYMALSRDLSGVAEAFRLEIGKLTDKMASLENDFKLLQERRTEMDGLERDALNLLLKYMKNKK